MVFSVPIALKLLLFLSIYLSFVELPAEAS